jgi:hypothetical protein
MSEASTVAVFHRDTWPHGKTQRQSATQSWQDWAARMSGEGELRTGGVYRRPYSDQLKAELERRRSRKERRVYQIGLLFSFELYALMYCAVMIGYADLRLAITIRLRLIEAQTRQKPQGFLLLSKQPQMSEVDFATVPEGVGLPHLYVWKGKVHSALCALPDAVLEPRGFPLPAPGR